MRRAIHNKLKSRAGASITFALLLFLVCAVVGSVVLAAGTAAAGRFSDLKEMDARYYSVTSAAGLLREQLSGKEVTVTTVKTTVTHTVTPYVNGTAGTPAVTSTETADEPAYTPGAPRVLVGAAEALKGGLSADETETLTLSHTPSAGIEAAPLGVTVTRVLSPNGDMKLTLRNTQGEPYSLILTFSCERRERVSTKTEEGPASVSASDTDNYTVTQDVTLRETTVVTYTWVLSDMRKAVAG